MGMLWRIEGVHAQRTRRSHTHGAAGMSACVHHWWVLEDQHGTPTVEGRCKHCGAVRRFEIHGVMRSGFNNRRKNDDDHNDALRSTEGGAVNVPVD